MTETTLPPGWTRSTLGEIGEYHNGRGFKKSEWRDEGRPIIRIQNLTGSGKSFNYFAGEADERHVVRKGDLLVSWAATLGVFKWDGPEAVLNQHIFKVDSHIHPEFHRYLLEHTLGVLQSKTHGSGMVHITRGRFDETEVWLPPTDEQRRIVEAVETHLSHLDVGVESLEQAKRNVERMRASLLREAFEPLPTARLGDYLREPLRNGKSAKASAEGKVRVLTLSAVTYGEFSDKNTKMVDLPREEVEDLFLESGDILVERSNTPELVGTARLYVGPDDWAIFPDLLIRVRLSDQVIPRFAELALSSSGMRRYLMSKAQGISGTMPKINQDILMEAPLPIADPAMQEQIVEIIDRQTSVLEALESSIEAALVRSMGLRAAVLGAAFRGDLTKVAAA